MPYITPDESYIKKRNHDYISRVFFLRQMGTILCSLPIASSLYEKSVSIFVLTILILNTFIWPFIAFIISKKNHDVLKAERRNLILDTCWAGGWIAYIGANPIPSAFIIAIMVADRFSAGGWKILQPALIAMVASFFIIWIPSGFRFDYSFSNRTIWLSLPLATIYPVLLSVVSRRLSVRLRKRREFLERQALIDPGIELPNRRFFEQKMTKAFLATNNGRSYAFLMLIDVDDFKKINDTYGHEVGDALLSKISVILRENLAEQDIPARFGGDELAIIVANSSEENVIAQAIMLKNKLCSLCLPSYENIRCTVSIGIASAKDCDSITTWIRNADQMLYEVKRNGKDGYRLYINK